MNYYERMMAKLAQPNKTANNETPEILRLQAELANIRQQSLHATRKGDFFKVATLGLKTRELNNRINSIKFGVAGGLPTESF